METLDELKTIAAQVRGDVIAMSRAAGAAHLASSLSCVDILVAAYWTAVKSDPARPDAPERDRFILSKGHAAAALYATLARRGYFPIELLSTFGKDGGCLPEQPSPGCAPGVEVATGSLGHGLPFGLGMALAGRIQKRHYRVFACLSDGECNEGSVWEAALVAPAHALDNLCVIVDYNKWQATGRSNEVTALESLPDKWRAFGWSVSEIDGHNMGELVELLGRVPDGSGKPIAIIANTIKGRGVSFMEDDNNWHYRVPSEAEVAAARVELQLT